MSEQGRARPLHFCHNPHFSYHSFIITMDHGICWSSPSSYGRSGRPTSDRIAVATVMVVFYVANRRVNVSTVDLFALTCHALPYRF